MALETEIETENMVCPECGEGHIFRGAIDIFDAEWDPDARAYRAGGTWVAVQRDGGARVQRINRRLEDQEHLIRIQFNCESGCEPVLRITNTNGVRAIKWGKKWTF